MDFQPMSPDDIQRMMKAIERERGQRAAEATLMQRRFDAKMKTLSKKMAVVNARITRLTATLDRIEEAQKKRAEERRLRGARPRRDRVAPRLKRLVELFERQQRDRNGGPSPH
jgi:hypothetical protein